MKTISMAGPMNAAFKQTQILPLLTGGMVAGRSRDLTFCPQCARAKPRDQNRAAAAAVSTRLPRPEADRNPAEVALLAVLTGSAAFCVGHALVKMFALMPHWSNFEAWVAQLIG